jgi:hypothetical protein
MKEGREEGESEESKSNDGTHLRRRCFMRESDDSREESDEEGVKAAEESTCAETGRNERHPGPHGTCDGWPTWQRHINQTANAMTHHRSNDTQWRDDVAQRGDHYCCRFNIYN